MKNKKKSNKKFPNEIFGFLMLAVISAFTAIGIFKAFITRFPKFNVTRITTVGVKDIRFSLPQNILGKNIFSLDLEFLKRQIEMEASGIECRQIRRQLPSEIVFYLYKRLPAAQLDLGRFFLLDAAGTIIEAASDMPYEGLPVIQGLQAKISHPQAGNTYASAHLKSALELIAGARLFKNYKLVKIDIEDPRQPKFFITMDKVRHKASLKAVPKIEIKYDPGDIKKTLKVLGVILNKRASFDDVQYIDLRNLNSPAVFEKKKQ